MRNALIAAMASAFLIVAADAAFADTVICRDGSKYVGVIIAENNDGLVMEVPRYPVRLTIYRGAVKEVRRGNESENAELKKRIAEVKRERGYIE